MAKWEGWESSEAARWEVPSFIQRWVSPRFKLFVFDITHRNKRADLFKIFLRGRTDG